MAEKRKRAHAAGGTAPLEPRRASLGAAPHAPAFSGPASCFEGEES